LTEKSDAPARVGIDIGGTFTDVVLETGADVFSTKILTTHEAPDRAILDGFEKVLALAGVTADKVSLIIHGTTLATNALIERSGAKTAFITTAGFRDVIEMRTENRFEQYDLNITLPPPLIKRNHRHVLPERIGPQGQVLHPLTDADLDAIVDAIIEGGYESVAVGLIHSYVNDVHEQRVRDHLLARKPDLSVSISAEVSAQMREFARFNTVCANAYVKPLMESYLRRLTGRLDAMGVSCPVTMIHSGGGLISIDHAARFPVRLVESGPAGGAIFAAHIAEQYGLDSVLSYDMGGTTAKICLIEDQNPKTAKTFEVARTYRFKKGSGMPISIPVIEMVEIGAGGGSIATVDTMRQIRVGPESAGSEPGPACYQKGGTRPTVTDANLLLGRFDPEAFAGGTIPLSQIDAKKAATGYIANDLGMNATEAAFGICEVVDENMANAARVHAVENGKDIADFTMIAFGGAAPLHAGRLCQKLGIDRFLVPPGAGVGSAIGFLRAPFGYESVRSAKVLLSAFNADHVNGLLGELTASTSGFVNNAFHDGNLNFERTAYMRYIGQGWEIPVALPERAFASGDDATFKTLFETAYKRYFGRPIEGLDIEVVSWSVKVSAPTPPVTPVEIVPGGKKAPPSGTRRIFDARIEQFVDADIVERTALDPGMQVTGPAVITEPETSTIVTGDFEAIMQSDGCLLVRLKGETEGQHRKGTRS